MNSNNILLIYIDCWIITALCVKNFPHLSNMMFHPITHLYESISKRKKKTSLVTRLKWRKTRKKNDSRIYQKLFCFVNENIIPLFYAAWFMCIRNVRIFIVLIIIFLKKSLEHFHRKLNLHFFFIHTLIYENNKTLYVTCNKLQKLPFF